MNFSASMINMDLLYIPFHFYRATFPVPFFALSWNLFATTHRRSTGTLYDSATRAMAAQYCLTTLPHTGPTGITFLYFYILNYIYRYFHNYTDITTIHLALVNLPTVISLLYQVQ